MYYLALIVSIVLNGASLVLLKAYARKREAVSRDDTNVGPPFATVAREHVVSVGARLRGLLDPLIIASGSLFVFAALTWMIALAGVDLSVAYPSMSVIYVATAVAGRYLFGEHISKKRWIGIALVMIGVTVMHIG